MRENKPERPQVAFVGTNMPVELKRRLVDAAQAKEMTLSEYVRQIIDEVISNTAKPARQARDMVRELDTSPKEGEE